MSRTEFLAKLREALTADLSSQQVEEHISFYNQYIYDEVQKGRMETDILAELGDPWVIARNILGTQDVAGRKDYIYGETDKGFEHSNSAHNNIKVFRMDSWWKIALVFIVVFVVLSAIFSVITGILRLVAPIAIPVIAVMLILKIWKK